jgi:acyl-CoA hydrolase
MFFGNLMGGRLMYWMDIAAAIAAQKHCNAPVVTASVDNISFESPIKLGNYRTYTGKCDQGHLTLQWRYI